MSNIVFTEDLADISPDNLESFFVGWPNAPSSETLYRLLTKSTYRVLALDGAKVIGYVTALSDDVLFGYISSIEVLPEIQGQGNAHPCFP